MTDVVRWICDNSRTPLDRVASDGARCGVSTHFHPRRGSGFLGAHPDPAVTYRDVTAEPKPIASPDQAEGQER